MSSDPRLRIAVKVDPEPFIKKFQQLQGHLDDDEMARFLEKSVVPYLHGRSKQRFATEAWGSWPDLAESTQADRYRLAPLNGWPIEPDHPINRRSGELRKFITTTHSIRRAGSKGPTLYIPRLGRTSQTLEKKFKTAQLGSTVTVKNNKTGQSHSWSVPARPVVDLNHSDTRAIQRRWSRWVGKVLKTI